MCFVEARSKKPKVRLKTDNQDPTTAPKPILEEGPRVHLNFNGTSGISFPVASVSKIPQYIFNPSCSAPAMAVLQSSSEFQSTSVTTKPKENHEKKAPGPLSTSISTHGNEIVKGAEELHRLASRLEDASANCSKSSRSSRRSRRSRSTDRSRASDRSRERSERRTQREKELERELEREREHVREWGREWGKQREREGYREILALEALEREKSNADRIKELQRERKMEKAIENEVQSQMQKVSSQASSDFHGLGNEQGFYDPTPSPRRWSMLRWGPMIDNESTLRDTTMREKETVGKRRERMGSLWEAAMGFGMGYGLGAGNGCGGGRIRHTGASNADDSPAGIHYHKHSHNHLHYHDLPSAADGGEYEHVVRRATVGDRERRKSSVVSMVSIMGGELVRRFWDGWTRAENEELSENERDAGTERKTRRGRERDLERERDRERYEASRSSHGYGYRGRHGTARRRGVIFDR